MGAEGEFVCLSLETGELLWRRQTSEEYGVPRDVFGVGHSPLLFEDLVILNIGGTIGESGIVAFDQATGAPRWSATRDGPSYATPVVARVYGRELLFVLTKAGLNALDPRTGEHFWFVEYQSQIADTATAVTPLVYGDIVLISVFGTGTQCLRVREQGPPETLWQDKRTLTSQFTPLSCVDGYVYGVHSLDQSFRCIELTSGRVQWRRKTDLRRCTHLVSDGRLWLYGEQGHLGLWDVDPGDCQERGLTAEPLLAGPCFSAPALCRGRLLVRNERELACFDVRRAEGSAIGAATASDQQTAAVD
jgi:outer membrane protein assembly factor BamB